MNPEEVYHEPDRLRFVVRVEYFDAVLEYRPTKDGVLDFRRVYVPVELRGRGLANQLVEHALGYARKNGVRIIPSCPFTAAYIDKHPEFRDLVAR